MIAMWGPLIITLAYTVIACVLGYSAKGKLDMNKVENWSSSGNTMGIIVMIFLTAAGNVSAYTFLGSPGWAFSRGVACFYVFVYCVLTTYTYYLIAPRITSLAINTGYRTQAEAIGKRFESSFLRILCGIVGTVALVGNSMVQIIGSGHILNIMSHGLIPMWLGELVIISAIAFYVFKSGLKAIGWTNVMQGVMMLTLSFVVGSFVLYTALGSFDFGEAFRNLAEVSPEHLTLPGKLGNFPPVFWTTSILISIITIWPQNWVFATGAKDPETARKTYCSLPLFYLVMVPMMIVGFVCALEISDYDGPVDQVALMYCLEHLPWWLIGLLGAGILAAAQSSAEPLLHTAAFTLTHDAIAPAKKMDEEKEGKLQRYILLVVIFLIAYPLALTNPAELVYILLVVYGFIGQLFPAMLGVFCWPRATKQGVIVGLIAGVTVVGLFNIVWPNPLYIHAGIWGLLVNIPVFVVVSLMTEPASENTLKKFFPQHIMELLYEEK